MKMVNTTSVLTVALAAGAIFTGAATAGASVISDTYGAANVAKGSNFAPAANDIIEQARKKKKKKRRFIGGSFRTD